VGDLQEQFPQLPEQIAGLLIKPEIEGLVKIVGRESEAHPAFGIIPSLDLERYHLPPIQGHKYRIARIGKSLNKANLRPS
jgi:hypothetical protein